MNLKEKRASIVKTLNEKKAAYLKSGEMSDDDKKTIRDLLTQIGNVDTELKKADNAAELVSQISALGDDDSSDTGNDAPADSNDDEEDSGKMDSKKSTPFGTAFIRDYEKKSGKSGFEKNKPVSFEMKAATDPILEGNDYNDITNQVDRNPVFPYLQRPTVASLFGSGTVGANNTSITYLVYDGTEGAPGVVAEGAAKPRFRMKPPHTETDTLKEIAGVYKISDTMLDDLDYIASDINQYAQQLVYVEEEKQILSGDGTGNNLQGILNRGIQTLGTDSHTDADRIFETRAMITNATGLQPDGVVINPADYQTLRLARDNNGQYFGGGYFTGQYGNGGVMQDPPLWGLRTIVTNSIPVGTVLVGAFNLGGTVFRKGGLKIESTLSNDDDFNNDLVSFRLRERLGLQVKFPKAFVKVTLGSASSSSSKSSK